ncbi:hypothetical protein M433DRAFT_144589 [Acidomyces richmondensis BFW]|nr:MAG: hypothetical protein FE78DRAFT_439677 [Acidomyces sp. 'richmondensis']KYG44757.1 hypothetical protein M433DRAFT_144589 [Acidomyces richmondensis BFW]
MSQDLLAAFTTPEQSKVETKPLFGANRIQPYHDPHSTIIDRDAAIIDDENEDDEFGDFEDASKLAAPERTFGFGHPPTTSGEQQGRCKPQDEPLTSTHEDPNVGRHPFAGNMDILFAADDDEYDAGADEIADLANNPEAAMAFSKRVIAEQNAAKQPQGSKHHPSFCFKNPSEVSMTGLEKEPANAQASKGESNHQGGQSKLTKLSRHVPSRKNPEVLFDAENVSENEEEDGDFGDFEVGSSATTKPAAEPSQKPVQATEPSIDLLDLNDDLAHETNPSRRTLVARAGKNIKDAKLPTVATRREQTMRPDDEWDDFEVVDAPEPILSHSSNIQKTSISPLQRSTPKLTADDTNQLPPTNIPPPAILLSIFPSLFASAHDVLFNPLSKLEVKQKQALLAHPATHMFLKGYITFAIVLGHVIAGRRLRWKRDRFLTQGMRIGPAAVGGKGGMKLAGLDKGEAAKEDREVLDTVTMWKDQVGRLRSAVSAAGSGVGAVKLPQVPDIAEQMPVRSLKATEGGITAPYPCALCGLKREERVAKVDVGVEDSFGEWWVEGMSMHLMCRNFWEEHKGKLRSR